MFNAMANGRVNLIGEHTDYNGGWVLPTAIPQNTKVILKKRGDQEVHARSLFKSGAQANYRLGHEKRCGDWLDYIQGATRILERDGYRIAGFDLEIESTVPVGSGLSSSAALEIALLKALKEAFSLELDDRKLALIGQRIENEFVGANVGIMDQMACNLAQWGEALFLDTQSLSYERISLPLQAFDLVVINSGISHRHSDGGYNQRRSECEAACAELGMKSLRELDFDESDKLKSLPEVLRRRARHVLTENERVHKAVAAIRAADLKKLGGLFLESHASMRDDYQVSLPEIDLLVELVCGQSGVFGARLTGGGFGGSIVALTEKGRGSEIAAAAAQEYSTLTGENPTVLVPA